MKWATVFLVAALAGGCSSNVYFSDDEGADRPDAPAIGDHPDALSQPYALGTEVGISLERADGRDGWQITSDAPAIVAVDPVVVAKDGHVHVQVHALAEGTASLIATDGGGHEQRRALLTVKTPDRARLFPHGPLRVIKADEAAIAPLQLSAARVVVAGKAVFAVAYFRGEERLYGRGVSQATGPAALMPAMVTSVGRQVNEWLTVAPTQAMTDDVHLAMNGATLATLAVTAVPEAQLAALELVEEAGEHKDDDAVWILAHATDDSGTDVYGVYFDWAVDGAMQFRSAGDKAPPQGDLYRYNVGGSTMKTVSAKRGPLMATHSARLRDGYVMDTTYLGCDAAPGGRAGGGGFVVAILLGAFVLRRRMAA